MLLLLGVEEEMREGGEDPGAWRPGAECCRTGAEVMAVGGPGVVMEWTSLEGLGAVGGGAGLGDTGGGIFFPSPGKIRGGW